MTPTVLEMTDSEWAETEVPYIKFFHAPPSHPITTEAHELVSGARQDEYGPPHEDFGRTAQLWSVVLDTPVTAEQVALCMVMLKLSREIHASKRDNRVDACGYLEALDLVLKNRTNEPIEQA